jgi:hypothetical protein
MRRNIYALTLTILFFVSASAQDHLKFSKTDSVQISQALNGFVHSLENLDADHLQNYFSAKATVFFPPSALVAERVEGRDSIMAVFRRFFDRVKAHKSGPPYIDIVPEKVKIDVVDHVAIVTFELPDKDGLSRRSVVMTNENGKWLILHLHASKISN